MRARLVFWLLAGNQIDLESLEVLYIIAPVDLNILPLFNAVESVSCFDLFVKFLCGALVRVETLVVLLVAFVDPQRGLLFDSRSGRYQTDHPLDVFRIVFADPIHVALDSKRDLETRFGAVEHFIWLKEVFDGCLRDQWIVERRHLNHLGDPERENQSHDEHSQKAARHRAERGLSIYIEALDWLCKQVNLLARRNQCLLKRRDCALVSWFSHKVFTTRIIFICFRKAD